MTFPNPILEPHPVTPPTPRQCSSRSIVYCGPQPPHTRHPPLPHIHTHTHPGGQIQCLDPQQAQNMTAAAVCNEALGRCRKGPVAMWAIGWLFLVVLSWVPCFYFCCCAQDPKPPASSVAYQNGTLQVRVQLFVAMMTALRAGMKAYNLLQTAYGHSGCYAIGWAGSPAQTGWHCRGVVCWWWWWWWLQWGCGGCTVSLCCK